jgi:hypothetical protein
MKGKTITIEIICEYEHPDEIYEQFLMALHNVVKEASKDKEIITKDSNTYCRIQVQHENT